MSLADVHLIILPVLLVSMTTRATVGFGEALIAMPLLTIFVGLDVAAPLVAINSVIISGVILIQDYKKIQLASAWRLLVGSVVGIPVGLWLLGGSYTDVLQIALGVFVIAFALYKLFRPDMTEIKGNSAAFFFGAAAGLLGGMYNTQGPPLVIYAALKRWPPESFRVTLQGVFFPTSVIICVGHALAGRWTGEVGANFLAALPVMGVAFLIGTWLNRKLPTGTFDRYIYVALIVIGGVLIAKTFG